MNPKAQAIPVIERSESKYSIRWKNIGRISEDWKVKIFEQVGSGLQLAIYDRETTIVRLEYFVENIPGISQLAVCPKSDAFDVDFSRFKNGKGVCVKVDDVTALEHLLNIYFGASTSATCEVVRVAPVEKNFQLHARQILQDFAQQIYLQPYDLVESGNGAEYINSSNQTLFTVYHNRLDLKNQGRIEIAIGIDNIADDIKCSTSKLEEWMYRAKGIFHKAESKSPKWWPRLALHTLEEVQEFCDDLRGFIEKSSLDFPGSVQPSGAPKKSNDERIPRDVLTRRGQPAFRKALLGAYNCQCAVSGCNDEAVLEAAHIIAHAESQDYRTENGLLLRADIHTLFDIHLLSIDPSSGEVVVSSELGETYQAFAGRKIRLPESPLNWPNPLSLMQHFKIWEKSQSRL